MSPSFEALQSALDSALRAAYGDEALLVETHADHLIAQLAAPADGEDARYVQLPYSSTDEGVELGEPTDPDDVDPALDDSIALTYAVAGMTGAPAGAKPPPAYIQAMPMVRQRQFCEVWNSAYARCIQGGGTAATCEASAFAQANGVVKQQSAPPVAASDVALDDLNAQVDAGFWLMHRLADASSIIPAWQPYHVIGKWVIPHGLSGKIQFTKEQGDSIIRNFKAGVLRRRVPFDERHLTEQNGIAMAEAEEFRWGQEGEGLPGAPEPSGAGPILYAKWRYNQLGRERLADRQYAYGSPQYSLNYQDKQTGTFYGPTALAYAGTNDPFIRNMRDLQGNPPMPWVNPASIAAHDVVVLTDGIQPYGGSTMPPTQPPAPPPVPPVPTTPPPPPPPPPPADVQLAERLQAVEVQLAAAEAARAASDAELAVERARAHERAVDTFLADFTYGRGEFGDGTSAGFPGVAAEARPWLLAAGERAAPIIRLADGEGAADTNFHEGLRRILRAIPRMPTGAVTRPTDRRPEDLLLADQLEETDLARGRAMAQQQFGGTRSAPAGQNGATHA